MINEQENYKRRYDLSAKLLQMGKALYDEGLENNQRAVSQAGSFLVLIGGVILDDNDVETFGSLCAMFSAKKLLDNMDSGNIPDLGGDNNADSVSNLLAKLRKLRDEADDLGDNL